MKDDEYAGVWEEYMRRNAAKKDYGEEKHNGSQTRPYMSLPSHPPNLQREDIPDDPISPAFDPQLLANSWDKHNSYPRDHKVDDGSWNKAPQPPPAPPLHIPKTQKEMKEYYPLWNDQVIAGLVASILIVVLLLQQDTDKHASTRLVNTKQQPASASTCSATRTLALPWKRKKTKSAGPNSASTRLTHTCETVSQSRNGVTGAVSGLVANQLRRRKEWVNSFPEREQCLAMNAHTQGATWG